MNERSCMNCHFGNLSNPHEYPCFRGDPMCFKNEDHPAWMPMTHGDKIREMPDKDLACLLFAYEGKRVRIPDILKWLEEEAKDDDHKKKRDFE